MRGSPRCRCRRPCQTEDPVRQFRRVGRWCLDGARGWNADQFGPARCRPLLVRIAPRGGRGTRWPGVGWFVGALLGPEGVDPRVRCEAGVGGFLVSGAGCLSYRSVSPWWGCRGLAVGMLTGGWLMVENCTVDASIF